MFTGLIETTGTVLSLAPTDGAMRIVVAAPQLAGRLRIGDSVAVNGTCLTALDVEQPNEQHPGRFAADLAAETIARTTLSLLSPGSLVNLELPTPAGAPLGGHVVQGHVDATGTLVSLVPLHAGQDASDWRMTLRLPTELRAYIVPQGSITVDGISLTVAKVSDTPAGEVQVEIAVIPHTYDSTNLHSLLSGSPINIETDVLGKYAERRAQVSPAASEARWTLSVGDLLRNGY